MGGGQTWNIKNFSQPEESLGGWADHYVTPGGTHECHPDYYAIPIGNPYGFMMCVKRLGDGGKRLDVVQNPIDPSKWNGYNKFSADLYRPWRDTQIQMYNPYYYHDRRTPHEAELIQKDYLRLPIEYNNTGVKPIHTPGKPPERTRFSEYGYSYTPYPPYKFDVTREEQPYPVWKATQEYHGKKKDELDQTYMTKNPGW